MKSLISYEDEYPIIWYQPNKALIKGNKPINFFEEFEEMLRFCEALETGFLVIVPNDLMSEEKLLEELRKLKEIYKRRLADFEEESVIPEISKIEQSLKAFVFYTRRDFEGELLTREEVEKVVRPNGVQITETSKDFRDELISWESNPKGQLYQSILWNTDERLIEKNHAECKEWCIKSLKELVLKRNREKIKMIFYLTLVESQKELNESIEALENCEKVSKTFQEIYGDTHPSTASSLTQIGIIHFRLGHQEKAHEFITKALEIRKAIYGEISSFVGESYHQLGLMLNAQDEDQKGIEHLLKAVEIFRAVYGEMHKSCAVVYDDIVNIYKELGDSEKVIEYSIKALEVRKAILGENDSQVAISLQNIASVYENLEEHHKALEYYNKALEVRKFNNEENLLCSASLYNNMVFTYCNLEEVEKAVECLLKALEIYRSSDGENRNVLDLYINLATIYYNREDYPQALESYLNALRVAKSLDGEVNSETEILYKDISEVYGNMGNEEKSTEFLRKYLHVKVTLQGEINREVANVHNDLSRKSSSLGNPSGALYHYLKALNIARAMFSARDILFPLYSSLNFFYDCLRKCQKEMICDKKSIFLEKLIAEELGVEVLKGGKIIVSEGVEKINLVGSNEENVGDRVNQEEVAEVEENNSILGKRSADSEASLDENPEPEVEKKLKQ